MKFAWVTLTRNQLQPEREREFLRMIEMEIFLLKVSEKVPSGVSRQLEKFVFVLCVNFFFFIASLTHFRERESESVKGLCVERFTQLRKIWNFYGKSFLSSRVCQLKTSLWHHPPHKNVNFSDFLLLTWCKKSSRIEKGSFFS